MPEKSFSLRERSNSKNRRVLALVELLSPGGAGILLPARKGHIWDPAERKWRHGPRRVRDTLRRSGRSD